jgi:transposase
MKKRKFHSLGFKTEVALEVLCGVKRINEIGQEFGIHPITIGHLKKVLQGKTKTLFEGKRGPTPIAAL